MTQPKKLPVKNGITARQKLLKTFSIDYTSPIDDVRYVGKFTTRKLTIADMATLGVRKAQLNGGMHHDSSNPGMGVDSSTDDFNAMISHLDLALEETPVWWDLEKITDSDLVALIFEEVVAHENSFFRPRRERSESGVVGEQNDDVGVGEGVGEGDQAQAGAGGSAGSVVDEEVQAALEP